MKVPHKKGVANHLGPESCGRRREAASEALTGELTGRAIEPRKTFNPVPTPSRHAEGNIGVTASARSSRTGRGPRPRACEEASRAEAGRPRQPTTEMAAWSAKGTRNGEA
jgi:hypothetical protein